VQVMSSVGAMQAAGHDQQYRTSSIVPALAKSARTGHPEFGNGKEKRGKVGHPPNPVSYATIFSDSSEIRNDLSKVKVPALSLQTTERQGRGSS
jgi:hypothetical protein